MASFLSINSGSSYFKKGTRKSENSLVNALERLSTGVRVNDASDDVAALSINNRLVAQLKGARTAIRNIADGASLLQTIESALGESTVALLRARELASRAANDYLSGNDLEAIKAEFNELLTHVDTISEQTTFNGIHVINGKHQEELSLQVSEVVGETVKLGPMKVDTDSLGRQARYTSARRGAFIGDLEEGQLMINGIAIRGTTESDDELSYSYASGSALAKVAAINQASPYTGVRAIAGPTIIEGFEPIRKMTLDEDHYFKINGHAISGFSYEDKDATGSLVSNINAAYEHTQVKAKLTEDGRINLIAEDGRNITIEYRGSSEKLSDPVKYDEAIKAKAAQVRDSIRIIDSFGDPINLAGTVDPVLTILDGDIDTISGAPITFTGTGFTGSFQVIADALTNDDLLVDSLVINPSNGFSPGDQGGYLSGATSAVGDHADFVLEIVEPGQLGTATFRVKEEPITAGTADTQLGTETYDWAVRGIYTDDTGKFDEASSSYYNEASNRLYTLTVTKGGSPTAPTPSGRPEFTYTVTNLDTGIIENTGLVPSPAIVSTSDVSLLHGVVLDINETITYSSNGTTRVSGQQMLESIVKPQGFTNHPIFQSWSGSKIIDYTITVEDSGHFTYNAPLSGSNTSAATLRIKGIERSSGTTIVNDLVTLNSGAGSSGQTISSGGLTFNINPQSVTPTLTKSMNNSTFGTTSSYMNGNSTVYTGPNNRTYKVEFLDTGRISSSSGLNAKVTVSDSGGVLTSYTTTITSGDTRLGVGTAYDEGVVLTLGESSTQRSIQTTKGDYNNVGISGTYSGVTDDSIIFSITNAGTVGVAQYEYYYSSDPGTKFTGTVSNSVSVGSGLSVKFNNATQTLDVGDEWKVTLDADIINSGANISLNTTSKNLIAGNQWQFTAEPPEWIVGDTYTINMKHNYSPTELTLPSDGVISLSNVGDFQITGASGYTFKTGDEIRVHTRGFTGTAVSGGTYGDNLYPTYYKIVITEPGEIGTAKFTWAREDGRQDLTQNPKVYGFNSDNVGPVGEQTVLAGGNILESGVKITWQNSSNTTIPSYLAVGDTFRIPVGQKLEYTFGGQITLQSEDKIHLEYSGAEIDNQLGRFLFQGSVEDNNIAGDEQSLTKGILGVNEDRSINDLNLDDRWAAEEAVNTLDLAVDQLSGMRSMLGALLNTLESQSRNNEERIANLSAASSRLVDADIALETAELTRTQIVRSLNPQLAQTERLSAMKTLDLLRLNSIG